MRPIKNLKGKVFGKLTAIKLIGQDKYRYAIWECVCEKGKTFIKTSAQLQRTKDLCCGECSKYIINICAVEGCGRDAKTKKYCDKHHREFNLHGKIRTDEEKREYRKIKRKREPKNYPCEICGNIPAYRNQKTNKLLCSRHSAQIYQNGEIRERTNKDPNEYEIIGDVVFIFLYNRKGEISGKTKIDLEDLDKCIQYHWCGSDNLHVLTRKNKKTIMLHRLIMNIDEHDIEVDHINHDVLDNRKCNLRLCTRQQNNYNHRPMSSKTGIKGVYLDKVGKYVAYAGNNGKKIHIGYYENIEDAKEARLEFERNVHKEFMYEKEKDVLRL